MRNVHRLIPMLCMIAMGGACAGKPLSPAGPEAGGRSIARAVLVTNLTGLAQVPSRLISNNGGSLISNNGGSIISDHGSGIIGKTKYRLATADPLVPLPKAQVVALDVLGNPVPNVAAATTDDNGGFTLHNVPVGAAIELRITLPQLQLTTLANPTIPPAPTQLDPATTLVTASLHRIFADKPADLAKVSGTHFGDLLFDVQQSLNDAPLLVDVSNQATALQTFDQLVALQPALNAKAQQIAADARAEASQAAPGGIEPFVPATAVPVATPGVSSPPLAAGVSAPPTVVAGTPLPAMPATPIPLPPAATAIPTATPTLTVPAPSPSQGGVMTVAGTSQGFQNGPATSAAFNAPSGVAVDGAGNIYVADSANDVIRLIDVNGNVSTYAGTAGSAGYVNAVGTAAKFNNPTGLAFEPVNQALLVADTGNNVLRSILPGGTVGDLSGPQAPNTLVGFVDGLQVNARFQGPTAIAVASSSLVYVADTGNNSIRSISIIAGPLITVATLAGGPAAGYVDSSGAAAQFAHPRGVSVGPDGTIYVADTGNNRIRAVTPQGAVRTLAGNGTPTLVPQGIVARANGHVYVSTAANTLVDIDTLGAITQVTGGAAAWVDGALGAARFSGPNGLALDASARLVVADVQNHRIRRVTP